MMFKRLRCGRSAFSSPSPQGTRPLIQRRKNSCTGTGSQTLMTAVKNIGYFITNGAIQGKGKLRLKSLNSPVCPGFGGRVLRV